MDITIALLTSHDRSPSAKATRLVCLQHWAHSTQGPSDNGQPVCREKAFFVLTMLRPGNGLKIQTSAGILSLI